jgi:hypothetical protein
MDHKERRVKNEHWFVWVKPALFLWVLELLVFEADWTIYLTASASVAFASGAVIGRPTFKDIRSGSKMDLTVSTWYIASVVGLVCGAIKYQETTPIDVLNGASGLGVLWWSTFSVLPVLIVIDLAWRLRMIHGGADAKALMWVALLVPSWSTMPLWFSSATPDALVALPPTFALLMWGGLCFFFIPLILLAMNIFRGHITSLSDLSLGWHAVQMRRSEVINRHVWVLTTLIEMPNGETKVHHRKRAPRRTPTDQQVMDSLEELKQAGVELVWVSHKLPLLVFLYPAIVPMVLFGDPMAILLPILGISS